MTARVRLPIEDVLPELLDALRSRGAAVLHAPTGAGKTTRVPDALLDADNLVDSGQILVLEPRRVAARAAARRVASERGESVGQTVGYQVRFDNQVGTETRVVFLTPGIFLRRLQSDPFLEDVGAVVFDEFHERSLDADLALALVRSIRSELRDDLVVVAMSATLDTARVAAWLDAPVVESRGRLFPIEIDFAGVGRPDHRDLPDRAARITADALAEPDAGDVLVFMPGVGEIQRTIRALDARTLPPRTRVLPLHGRLRSNEQDRIFVPHDGPTVVVATNIAETSLTIPGIRTVIDGGLARVVRYDPAIGLERLELERISAESAAQRAGRAGREAPGRAIRLWSETDDRRLDAFTAPEITRVDLAAVCLQLAAWGERDITDFGWFEPPERAAVERALDLLVDLGALERDDARHIAITPLGRLLQRLPAAPRVARLVLEGAALGCLDEACTAAAVIAERTPASLSESRHPLESDVLHAARNLRKSRDPAVRWTRRVVDQLVRAAKPLRTEARALLHVTEADGGAARAILAGFPDRLAMRRSAGDPRAVMVGGRGLTFEGRGASRLRDDIELFVAVDLTAGRRGAGSEALVRAASGVEREWLQIDQKIALRFDATLGRVVAERQKRLGGLVLESHPAKAPTGPEVARLLGDAAIDRLPVLLRLNDPESALSQWLRRVAFLRAHCPELELPELDERQLGSWVRDACHGHRDLAELRRKNWPTIFGQRIGWTAQQAIETDAPTGLTVPSGRRRKLTWSALAAPDEAPVLAVRIQELFGLTDTPRVARGRVPVTLHLLAPNYRPQQVTQDLAGFWTRTYPEIRKELRARYPKHAWPEDPVAAAPIAR